MCASLKVFCWSSVDYKRGEDRAWSSTKHCKQPTRLCCWRGNSVTLHRWCWSQTLWVSWKKDGWSWLLGVSGYLLILTESTMSVVAKTETLAGSMNHSLLSYLNHWQLPMIILNLKWIIHLYMCMLGLGRLFTQCSPTLPYSVHFHTVWLSGLQLSLSLRRTCMKHWCVLNQADSYTTVTDPFIVSLTSVSLLNRHKAAVIIRKP